MAAAPYPPSDAAIETTPLSEILENPSAWNGRQVGVQGFLILQYEGNSIWIDETDFRAGRYGRSLWVDYPVDVRSEHPLNGKRALLTGTIRAEGSYDGHLDLWPAAIVVDGIAADPTDQDRPRPWQNDPLFVILASLGFLGLILGMTALGLRARPITPR
ncbi:hypothetical protein [Brevundimonas sp.]|uniref:hypothetical protein n=1 Tax=Brevundimonas sp. TaxID=1871086 RepID=UPI003518DA70